MDDDFIEAINATADTSFDASRTFGRNEIARRPSESTTAGFYRPGKRPGGERAKCLLDSNGCPYPLANDPAPIYNGPPSGRVPTNDEKRGAWHLQAEYLADRLGKNKEENSRNWDTIKWIDKHYRVVTTPAEALPPLNIYVGDKKSQSTEGSGAPTGPDDEAPAEVAENEGIKFESINVCQTYERGNTKVMDEDGTIHRLDLKTDGYRLLRLVDALNEIDESAKTDVNDLVREAPPVMPQADFPSDDQRAESGKIIRILMMGMRSLWHPVIRAIADHATMASLAPGKGKDVAAAVGRQRVIDGLRFAESIRKGLARREFVMQRTLEPSYTVATCLDEIIISVLPAMIAALMAPIDVPAIQSGS